MHQGFWVKAGDKTRTCDRLITNQLLYQLSYTSKSIFKYNGPTVLLGPFNPGLGRNGGGW